jgi:hypothetical protein
MSEYDYPPEPTNEELEEHRQKQTVMNTPNVSIQGLTVEAVHTIILASVESIFSENYRDWVRECIQKKVAEAVQNALGETLNDLAADVLKPRVEAIVERGWVQTNSYGEPKGEPKKLDTMLREALFSENNYHNARQGLAVKTFEEALQKALQGELGAALKEAQAKVRKMVDETVMGKFQQSLREGLGLKS